MRSCLIATLCLLSVGIATGQDQLVRQAIKKLDAVEAALQNLGDPNSLNGLVADLNWAAKRLSASYDKSDTHYLAAMKRHQTLVEAVQAAQAAVKGGPAPGKGYHAEALAQLEKEVQNGHRNLLLLNKSYMGDGNRVGSIKRELDGLRRRLAEFPADDAAVQAVASKFKAFEGQFTTWMDEYQADAARSGDVNARLEQLAALYESENAPDRLMAPFDTESLTRWVQCVKSYRDVHIPRDTAWLQSVADMAAIDKNRRQTLMHWIGSTWPRRIQESTTVVLSQIETQIADALRFVTFIEETDITDRDQVVNRVLGEGAFERGMQRIQSGLDAVAWARMIDSELGTVGSEPAPDRSAQESKLRQGSERMQSLAASALEMVRMPQSRSESPDLLKAAEETLKRPKYKVGDWKRLVINSDVKRREKKEATLTPGTVNTRVALYHYVWDEFQVTTVEKEGDTWWIYYNTLKFFHSGDTTTPIDHWILSSRFKSSPIVEANIDK